MRGGWSPPPGEIERKHPRHAEFVTCNYTIEAVFRDSKQFAELEACQCWVDQAMVRHVALVLLTFVTLQLLRHTPDEPVGTVKERWQLAVIQDGERPPPSLRVCPVEL